MDGGTSEPKGAMSIRAIAAALRKSPTTVLKDIQQSPEYQTREDGTIDVYPVFGLDGKVRPGRRVDTTARDEHIRALRAAGQSLRAIATQVGCSVGTVHRVLKSRR